MHAPRARALALNLVVGVAGFAFVWWLMGPVTSNGEVEPSLGGVIGLGGPALVAASFTGVAQSFLLRAGGTVLTAAAVLATACIAVLSAWSIVAFSHFTLLAASGPALPPTVGEFRTAEALWATYAAGLVVTAFSVWNPLGVLFPRPAQTTSPSRRGSSR